MKTTYNDGQIITELLTTTDGWWSETIEGPGGKLVHTARLPSPSPQLVGKYPFDGVFTDLVGVEHKCPVLPEGSDYGECLEAVYGPELWAQREATVTVRRFGRTPFDEGGEIQ